MGKDKNSDLVLDRLRNSLAYAPPELQELQWDIAKQEVYGMTESSGPSKVDIGGLCLLFGIGIGIFGVKWFPKTIVVRYVKYMKEVIAVGNRLNKIAIEESYRLDDAIQVEEQFLNMMSQDLPLETKIVVVDEDGQRKVRTDTKIQRKKKKEEDG